MGSVCGSVQCCSGLWFGYAGCFMSLAKTLSKYPKLGSVTPRPKNTSAKCACGKVGKFFTEIQWDWMRGNDDVFWSCEEHKKDLEFHTGGAKWE